MHRLLTAVAALSVAALLTSTADAGAKGKKKGTAEITAGGTVTGTIKSVSDDGKTLTVETPGPKKKSPATSTDVKITDTTKVEYTGIDGKDDQKLAAGYAVTVQLADGSKDTASSVKVSKVAETAKKKKKKADK